MKFECPSPPRPMPRRLVVSIAVGVLLSSFRFDHRMLRLPMRSRCGSNEARSSSGQENWGRKMTIPCRDQSATCFPGGFQSIANCQDGVSGSGCIHRPIRSVAVETWCNTPGGRANHRAKSRHSRRVTTAITGRRELIRYQKKPRHRRSVASHGDIAS